jgi:hypothetical protein
LVVAALNAVVDQNVGAGDDRAGGQVLLAVAGRNAGIVVVDLEAEIALLLTGWPSVVRSSSLSCPF